MPCCHEDRFHGQVKSAKRTSTGGSSPRILEMVSICAWDWVFEHLGDEEEHEETDPESDSEWRRG